LISERSLLTNKKETPPKVGFFFLRIFIGMMKLIDLLKEYDNKYHFRNKLHLFPAAAGDSAMIGVVISAGNGLTPKEADKIIDLFKRIDKSADLKYFPATKKIVGKVAVASAFDKVTVSMTPTIDKVKHKIKGDLLKIRKDLEIKKKVAPK